jgi:hypothetical protein
VNFEPKIDLDLIPDDWRCQICLEAALKSPVPHGIFRPPVSPADVKSMVASKVSVQQPQHNSTFGDHCMTHLQSSNLPRNAAQSTANVMYSRMSTVNEHVAGPSDQQSDSDAKVQLLEKMVQEMSLEIKHLRNSAGHPHQMQPSEYVPPMNSPSPHFASGGPTCPVNAGAAQLFSVDHHRPAIFRHAKEVSMGFSQPLVGVEKQTNIKWTDPISGATEKLSSMSAVVDIYSWKKEQYHQWCTECLACFESEMNGEGISQTIALMRELEEVAHISNDSWDVMHLYLVKRYSQLMDGVNVGMHLGVLDHSILLQAQGVAKVKTTNQFDERFAKLEVQMSKLAEKAKAPKNEEPKTKKGVLSESEFEVYKEWSKLHPTACPKCGTTYEGYTEGRPSS